MTVITRFAPSPTGFLHIGGARTALFNWLYAKHHGGEFRLRIEDTDKKRSTKEAVDAILDGMKWLGLDHDNKVIYQSENASHHAEVAHKLLDIDAAYKCYCTTEELTAMREEAQANGKVFRYNNMWRNRDESQAPTGVNPVIRLRSKIDGTSIINDIVQGEIKVPNAEIDDLILLRSDGSPTYMLAVVVDDHDMGITHAIRGDDHLTNAFRQKAIYEALGWDIPEFAHIPLIHGADGAKLSKRHGALGIDAYRDMGYLPESIRNYLLRLGWSHGDDEFISDKQAIEWFNLDSVGKSPSRFDFTKLENVNSHYMKISDNEKLVELISPIIEKITEEKIDELGYSRLKSSMDELKERAKTINELAENAAFYIKRPVFTEQALKIINDGGGEVVSKLIPTLESIVDWQTETIKESVKSFAKDNELKLGKIAQPLRASLTGSTISPGIFDILYILGKEETIERLTNLE